MTKLWSRATVGAALCAVAAGCGGVASDNAAPATTGTITVSSPVVAPGGVTTCKGGPACSNKEVTETGCDDGNANGQGYVKPVDAIPAQPVDLNSKVRGVLALHLSNPQACSNIFWAHFVPAPNNESEFEVYVVVNDKPSVAQASLSKNLLEWAWSVGMYAPKGAKVTACVRPKGGADGRCLTPITVV